METGPVRSVRPFTRENLAGRPGHEDGRLVERPLELEVAPRQMSEDQAVGPPCEHSGDADGAGTRAAGQGDPRAALPRTHPNLARPHQLDNVHIDPPVECPVM